MPFLNAKTWKTCVDCSWRSPYFYIKIYELSKVHSETVTVRKTCKGSAKASVLFWLAWVKSNFFIII